MGIKLLKRKTNKQNSVGNHGSDRLKTINTPSKVGTNNGTAAATTPDTVPGSPVPQQDMELLVSTPNAMAVTRPSPTSYNQRIMEGETPLVSNVASRSQLGRNNISGVPHLNKSAQQARSNQIRDEISQYYDERDKEDSRLMLNTMNNKSSSNMALEPIQETKKGLVTRTFTQPNVGVRAFSMDESEEVELQLSSGAQVQGGSPVLGSTRTTNKTKNTISRSVSPNLVPKFVSKINHDEVSVPSLITEPEGTMLVRGLSVMKENGKLNETQQGPESTWSKVSLKNKLIDGGQSIDDAIKSLFSGNSPQQNHDTPTSAATQAGGIEMLLGFLQCNEDTTLDALCGGMREKDMVDLETEQEQQFALKFNNVSVLFQ
jgi:hypothetical protein